MIKRILITAILLLSGCSSDNRVVIKPKQIDTNSYGFLRAISVHTKNRYETSLTVEEIMAEISYQQYLLEK